MLIIAHERYDACVTVILVGAGRSRRQDTHYICSGTNCQLAKHTDTQTDEQHGKGMLDLSVLGWICYMDLRGQLLKHAEAASGQFADAAMSPLLHVAKAPRMAVQSALQCCSAGSC